MFILSCIWGSPRFDPCYGRARCASRRHGRLFLAWHMSSGSEPMQLGGERRLGPCAAVRRPEIRDDQPGHDLLERFGAAAEDLLERVAERILVFARGRRA